MAILPGRCWKRNRLRYSKFKQLLNGGLQAGCGQKVLLKRRSEGNGCVEASDARDGSVEMAEAMFCDPGTKLCANAAGERVFMKNENAAGFLHGVHHCFF